MNHSQARRLLAEALADAEVQLAAMAGDFERLTAASADSNLDDEHDPEGATVGFERAQLAAVLAQSRQHQLDLQDALARLGAGRYGRCERCGAPIGDERLAALPATRYCIRCAAGAR